MRKFLIPLAAAAATIGFAAPAAAQVHVSIGTGPAYGYGYGTPYGYGYGYNRMGSHWANQLRQIRYQTRLLANHGRLTRAEMVDMNRDIRRAEYAIRSSARRGISPWEAQRMDQRIVRLQYQLQRYSDWDRRGHRYSNGYGRGW